MIGAESAILDIFDNVRKNFSLFLLMPATLGKFYGFAKGKAMLQIGKFSIFPIGKVVVTKQYEGQATTLDNINDCTLQYAS